MISHMVVSLPPPILAELEKAAPILPSSYGRPATGCGTFRIKMEEYIANGLQLGWLIDPQERQVFVYSPPGQVDHLQNPSHLSGEPMLAGFQLDLTDIWTVDF